MRFALMVILGVFAFTVQALADGGFQASVEMPVSVRILDYHTTRQICGDIDAPSWCPAHLLTSRPEVARSNDVADNARQRIQVLQSAELEKRRRMQ